MRTKQIYAAATNATTNDLAHIDLVQAERLRAIVWQITGTAPADADRLRYELSTAAAAQMTTNDANDILDIFGYGFDLVTSGSAQIAVAKQTLLDIALKAGSRIYLHQIGVVGGSAAYDVRAILHFA